MSTLGQVLEINSWIRDLLSEVNQKTTPTSMDCKNEKACLYSWLLSERSGQIDSCSRKLKILKSLNAYSNALS